jgi:hypothetical protein
MKLKPQWDFMRQPHGEHDDHPYGQGERHDPREDGQKGQKVLHFVR